MPRFALRYTWFESFICMLAPVPANVFHCEAKRQSMWGWRACSFGYITGEADFAHQGFQLNRSCFDPLTHCLGERAFWCGFLILSTFDVRRIKFSQLTDCELRQSVRSAQIFPSFCHPRAGFQAQFKLSSCVPAEASDTFCNKIYQAAKATRSANQWRRKKRASEPQNKHHNLNLTMFVSFLFTFLPRRPALGKTTDERL